MGGTSAGLPSKFYKSISVRVVIRFQAIHVFGMISSSFMQKQEITAIFDQQAPTYDQKWNEMAPINSALHLLAGSVLSGLPANARILCVGAGTGREILYLAQKNPGWHFTAVEPSIEMLNVFRNRAEEYGISSRCAFHHGFLDSLQAEAAFDAATALLVSHFILERDVRVQFFQTIANHLRPKGVLISSDLAGDLKAAADQSLLEVWIRVMTNNGIPQEAIQKIREAYTRDLAILPLKNVVEILTLAGFDSPVHFFQAGMIHAWYAKRAGERTE